MHISLVERLPATTAIEGILAHRPELLTKYRTFYQSFWADGLVAPRVLELCRRRIAYIHSCAAELAIVDDDILLGADAESALQSGEVSFFDDSEQAALIIAELMPFGVHQISDEQVQSASDAFGHGGVVALLTALAFFDVSCRMKLVLEVPVESLSLTQDVIA